MLDGTVEADNKKCNLADGQVDSDDDIIGFWHKQG
ncbi:hypothetical protein PPTG_22328 [Phytophthora nicotianae INRA-310]|uniref:Uncharacterized protein n=1 Tax=Phytophthora nicotianae (strain INRA-310) TaxID=761204 RepID=W2QJH7_PHYN3|nr:hypothetical protein PPTG_22328 [Phytophthora nicotianae INRA-310]ETN13302.1 hypothetical protein PPTG_22328 [Phytophthora nicotianae INRA-310]